MKKKLNKKLIVGLSLFFIFSMSAFFSGYGIYVKNVQNYTPPPLSPEQAQVLKECVNKNFPEKIIQKLPYEIKTDQLNLNAKSAIIIDEKTGWILYEKNADDRIPPASMTKLVLMYAILDELEKGNFSLDDIVPLPEECWAKNAPPHSSLMFLGKDQTVSLDEILLGMNIVSGNDAAFAASIYVFGSVQNCLDRMNNIVKNLGLKETHFAEVSGYSEENITTAKEFVSFSRKYLTRFPFTTEKYHKVQSFMYPKEHNLPSWITYEQAKNQGSALEGTLPIVQQATNKALFAIPGADGLKTGYIDEAGFNLALSVKQDGHRLIAVTMGGGGNNPIEGNKLRTQDAITLTNWAFSAFDSVSFDTSKKINLKCFGGKYYGFNLLENNLEDKNFICVPAIKDKNGKDFEIYTKNIIDRNIPDQIYAGNQYGKTEYYMGNYLIQTVPLVADRNIPRGNVFRVLYGKLYKKLHSTDTNKT
ncbi:MAG: D-alanyl-D-alanine carboxypeptidase family protein [Treponemataceae bacterium]